ncbi:MAG: cysteine synthase A [Myxococcaceae bacterium]|nr:cysteine synthase A [Myxococcaceae bacterium]
MIHRDVVSAVGRTPLVQLQRVGRELGARLVVKLEAFNPSASVKDRVAAAMIFTAETEGRLKPGATLIEATSGNTGIGLAVAAAAKGYRLVLTMPERMSRERISLLEYLGAEVVLTEGALMKPAVEKAKALLAVTPGAVMLDQFSNPANPAIHERVTAEELWADTEGRIDVFVAGVGTGGTITGVGRALKKRKPAVHIVAVEPEKCAVLSGGAPGHHLLQGIGAGFVPAILDRNVIDEVVTVSEDDAFANARRLAKEEGIGSGISSGAALTAALKLAPRFKDRMVVVLLADSGERYLTTPLVGELTR